VYDLQAAQNVSCYQGSAALDSEFRIVVTARPSADTPEAALDKLKAIIDEELNRLRDTPPEVREMERVLNGLESSFYSQMERVNGQARQLNAYFARTGNPDYFNEDIARYRALSPNDIQAAVRHWLPADRRLEFSVLPEGK
jgi:zinc protease